jgi:hypothetical protein
MADQKEQTIESNHMFCAHCGTENTKGSYACTRCGERLIEVTTTTVAPMGLVSCSRCGGASNTSAAYCWVCGTEMNDAVRISAAAKPRPQARPEARTFRPDLNPVSTPTTERNTESMAGEPVGTQTDLRGAAPEQSPEIQAPVDSPFGSDASAPNSSGTRNGEVPPSIKRWNWAAFLMPAVWGLFSGVPYTAILFGAALLPPQLQLIVMASASVYLGLKGNELAWRGKKWRSVEHFQAFQKQWASWAVKLTIAVAAILLFYVMTRGGA